MSTAVHFSLMTPAEGQEPAGKAFWLADGRLEKATKGTRSRYKALRQSQTMRGLAAMLKGLQGLPEGAYIAGGLYDPQEVTAITSKAWAEAVRMQRADGLSTMTMRHCSWRDLPALMVIDSDGLSIQEALDDLRVVLPGLDAMPWVAVPSSGSCILDEDGTVLRGERGCHVYLAVSDGRMVPEALLRLHRRLVAAGRGRFRLSAAGSLLERSAVDRALRSPVQPIFVRPVLGAGLWQDRSGIQMGELDGDPIDVQTAIPDLSEDEWMAYRREVAAAYRRLAPEAKVVQAQHAQQRISEMVAAGASQEAAQRAVAAARGGVLTSEVQIVTERGVVAVGAVLGDPKAWDGVACADPVEPAYGCGVGIARIYASQGHPIIHSFAHGGATYRLRLAHGVTEVVDVLAEFEAAARRVEGDSKVLERLMAPPKPIAQPGVLEAILKAALGLEHALPDGWVPVNEPGLFGVLDPDGGFHRPAANLGDVQSAGARKLARDGDPLAAVDAIVKLGLTEGRDDAGLKLMASTLATAWALPSKELHAILSERTAAWQVAREEAIDKAAPAPIVDVEAIEPSGEVEALQRRLDVQSKLGDITHDPVGFITQVADRMGVVGERQTLLTTMLAFLSVRLARDPKDSVKFCLILKGKPGQGKSWVLTAAQRLVPADWVVDVSSMTGRSMQYFKPGFKNKTIVLAEGEILSKKSEGDTNDVAESLRVVLSEGFLRHMSVEKNSLGELETFIHEIEGPTGLVTSTTRGRLEPEIESRMLSLRVDSSAEHQEEVKRRIAASNAKLADPEAKAALQADIERVQSLMAWVAEDKPRVVIPFAPAIAGGYNVTGSRMFRDFNSLTAVIKSIAVLHRALRDVDEHGAIVATVDDYRLAYSMLGESMAEDAGLKVPETLRPTLEAIKAAIKTHPDPMDLGHGFGGDSTNRRSTVVTRRQLAKLMGVSLETIHTAIQGLALHGLIQISKPSQRNQPDTMRVTEDGMAWTPGSWLGNAIPDPDTLEADLEDSCPF